MSKKFNIYVLTPNGERIYIATFRHMNQRLKDKVNTLRGALYYGHSVIVKGGVNEIPMASFRPMTETSMIECIEALAPYRRRDAQRMNNLRKIKQGNVPARPLAMIEHVKPKPGLVDRIGQKIARFERKTRELLNSVPATLLIEHHPVLEKAGENPKNGTAILEVPRPAIEVIAGVEHIPGLPRMFATGTPTMQ